MTHHRPHLAMRLEHGRLLASRQVCAKLAERNVDQVRRHCSPVACDVASRMPLYDPDEAVPVLTALRRRVAA